MTRRLTVTAVNHIKEELTSALHNIWLQLVTFTVLLWHLSLWRNHVAVVALDQTSLTPAGVKGQSKIDCDIYLTDKLFRAKRPPPFLSTVIWESLTRFALWKIQVSFETALPEYEICVLPTALGGSALAEFARATVRTCIDAMLYAGTPQVEQRASCISAAMFWKHDLMC